MLLLSSANFFFQKYFFKNSFRSTNRVSNGWDPVKDACRTLSGSKLFVKVISRRQKSVLISEDKVIVSID